MDARRQRHIKPLLGNKQLLEIIDQISVTAHREMRGDDEEKFPCDPPVSDYALSLTSG